MAVDEEINIRELWAEGKAIELEDDPAYLSRQAVIRTKATLKSIIRQLSTTQDTYHEIEKCNPPSTSKFVRLLGLGEEIRWLKKERKRLERKLSYHQEMVKKLTPTPAEKLDKMIADYEEKLKILKEKRSKM